MVGIGGFAGSALRYAISRAMLPLAAMSHFPWHSLLVNVVGSLLIGSLVACRLTGHWYYLAVIGFCGGFATFSMFSLEMFKMIRLGYTSGAILYLVVSIALSLLAVAGGFFLITKYN